MHAAAGPSGVQTLRRAAVWFFLHVNVRLDRVRLHSRPDSTSPGPITGLGGPQLGGKQHHLRQGACRCRPQWSSDPAQGCSRVLLHVNVRLARVRLRSRPVSTSPGSVTGLGGSWKGDAAPEAVCTPLPASVMSRPCPGLQQGSFACRCLFGRRDTPFSPCQHESRTRHRLEGVLEGGYGARGRVHAAAGASDVQTLPRAAAGLFRMSMFVWTA